MTDILEVGNNGGMGGLGGGMMGGLLAGALFGGGLGNRNLDNRLPVGEGCVTPSQLTAALAGVQDTNMNTAVLQTLGAIQGAIPVAEGQVQLALAGATADINGNISAAIQTAINGQAGINKNISEAIASSLASQNAINMNVMANGAANISATKDSQYATAVAISNSTKEILAALNAQNVDNLQRQLTVAETALAEQRNEGRFRQSEINITNTNTATAQQFQVQQQQQQQFQILANLSANLANLANDVQVVRQGQTIFNSGTMAASGTQAAANTKVN